MHCNSVSIANLAMPNAGILMLKLDRCSVLREHVAGQVAMVLSASM